MSDNNHSDFMPLNLSEYSADCYSNATTQQISSFMFNNTIRK